MHRIKVFFRNGIILTFTSLIIKFISMWLNIFLSNTVSSDILGTWSILMSVFFFLSTIAQSGINLASTRLIAEENSQGNQYNIPHILKSCLHYSVVFSLISIFICIIFSSYITHNILKDALPIYLIYLLALSLPFCSMSSCLQGYFMAVQKIFVFSIALLIEIFIQIIVVLLFYWMNILNTAENVCLALILGLTMSDFCSFIFAFYTYNKQVKPFRHNYKKNYIKQICKISLPVAITTYIKSGLSTLKNALIPITLTAYGFSYDKSLSYYGLISTTVMSLLLFPYTFIQSYGSLLIPKLSTYNKKTEMKKITSISFKSLKFTLFFSIFICTFFIIFAKFINEKMYSALHISTFIKILSPIIIYIYMDNVIDNILKSLDFQVFVMIINVIDLVISISLIKILIPKFGIGGYIFILYFSEVFNFLLSLSVLKLKTKQKR